MLLLITMSKIEIEGNNNQVYNRIKRSRINTDDISWEPKRHWATWITISVAVLTLIATCIIGWDKIVVIFG